MCLNGRRKMDRNDEDKEWAWGKGKCQAENIEWHDKKRGKSERWRQTSLKERGEKKGGRQKIRI